MANNGGGYVAIGLSEGTQGLESRDCPSEIPEVTQDTVNAAITRYATPEFHCKVILVRHSITGVSHPVIVVPRDIKVPVMSKRECSGVIHMHRCYIRKPGPRSEEPKSSEEWRRLLDRCIRTGREELLESIRAIVTGRVEQHDSEHGTLSELEEFCTESNVRWQNLVAALPSDSPARFPNGFYEMGFSIVGATRARSLTEVRNRLKEARRVTLTGWPPFLDMSTPGWAPYAHEHHVEAWVGRPVRERPGERSAAHSDFWRVSMGGQLYIIRGYQEDDLEQEPVGEAFDATLPIWRVGEGILFAGKFAETFEHVESVAIRCRYTGLTGRRLCSVTRGYPFFGEEISNTDGTTLTYQVTPQQIRDNLAEILYELLRPLYECFSFYQPAFVLVEQELEELRR